MTFTAEEFGEQRRGVRCRLAQPRHVRVRGDQGESTAVGEQAVPFDRHGQAHRQGGKGVRHGRQTKYATGPSDLSWSRLRSVLNLFYYISFVCVDCSR